MTPLVERALSNAGLLAALDARASGATTALEALRPAIDAADWLLLGAGKPPKAAQVLAAVELEAMSQEVVVALLAVSVV
jgi:hypothetical protein